MLQISTAFRKRFARLRWCSWWATAVLTLSFCTASADTLPTFQITDIKGETRTIGEQGSETSNVFVFILNDCPISNQYQPKLSRLASQFGTKQIRFHFIHADPQTTPPLARKHATDFHIDSPIYLDPQHHLVKRLKATMTPEVVVLDRHNELVYQGRIDNLYFKLGRKRFKATEHNLKDTLQAIVDGTPIPTARTKAIGCYIPTLDSD